MAVWVVVEGKGGSRSDGACEAGDKNASDEDGLVSAEENEGENG